MQRLVLVIALLALPFLARAKQADCSMAPPWSSAHRYEKNDVAWRHEGGYLYELYRCDTAECRDSPDDGATWKRMGLCTKTPS